MARVKIAIIGGGSAYCAGLMEAFVRAGHLLRGSEICLMDINRETLEIIWKLGSRMAEAPGADMTVTRTPDRRAAIADANFVLTTFRPGGLQARVLDERIPLKHGVIGQETQGPGGFFMALRTIPVMQAIVAEMEAVAPRAILLNYTNPVNIVVEAVTHHTSINTIGLCEGPILFSRQVAELSGIDPDTVEVETIGINHANWSTRFTSNGTDLMPRVLAAAPAVLRDPAIEAPTARMFRLIQRFKRLPSEYLQYYYFHDEVLAELKSRPRCRAQEILAMQDRYFEHYREEAAKKEPVLRLYRGRIHLGRFSVLGDFAVQVIHAIANNTGETLILNVPGRGATSSFPDDRVVEVPTVVTSEGAKPMPAARLEPQIAGLLQMLAEYQYLTAIAAWRGTRDDAVLALASNPLILTFGKAQAIYDEMAAAHRDYLPARLL